MLLATDLDGTFLGGDTSTRHLLYRLIRDIAGLRLVFVTGRGLENVIPLLKDRDIPLPEFIICDVGATIVYGNILKPVQPLQNEIEKKWLGTDKVLKLLNGLEGLKYQEVPQQRRCSFCVTNPLVAEKAGMIVKAAGYDVIYSAGKFLDVMPPGVNKGSSLLALVEHLDIKKAAVMVAGDTLNDLSLYKYGFKGVVVQNAEYKLKEITSSIPDIYFSKSEGAGGIMECLQHFNWDTHLRGN